MSISDEQLLRDCGALTDDGLTFAALILFGKQKSLARRLPQAEVVFEYRSKESAGPAAQRVEFREGFFNYNDRIWELVNLRNDNQHYQNGFAVHPVPTFNEEVVREAVLNAISHREYQLGGSVFIRQYSNRLVVESPGGFPWGITSDNILDRQSPRNNLIAEIFQLSGLVERSGQGMNLMYELAMKQAKPLPDFAGSDAYYIMLTLNGTAIDTRMLAFVKKTDEGLIDALTVDDYILLGQMYQGKDVDFANPSRYDHLVELGVVRFNERGLDLIDAGITFLFHDSTIAPEISQQDSNQSSIGGQSAVTADKAPIDLGKRNLQVLAYISDNKKVTSAQLVDFTGLSQRRVREILQELITDGVLVKIGNYRYTSYGLKNNDN
jgi:ATP-dependent DNA helicase RecG